MDGPLDSQGHGQDGHNTLPGGYLGILHPGVGGGVQHAYSLALQDLRQAALGVHHPLVQVGVAEPPPGAVDQPLLAGVQDHDRAGAGRQRPGGGMGHVPQHLLHRQ